MHEPHALMANPLLSRRAFFSVTAITGALSFLGAAGDGRVIAYADEAGNHHFAVTIVSRRHIIAVMTDISNNNAVVSGATVTVRSLCNDQTVSGVTDETGFVLLNIQQLAEDPSDEADEYAFWGRVSAVRDGYREYEHYRTFIAGGAAPADETGARSVNLQIPTQPFDAARDGAYVRTLAFDDNDIQYEQATFAATPKNDAEHVITMQVMAARGSVITGWISINGTRASEKLTLTAVDFGGDTSMEAADLATRAEGTGALFRFADTFIKQWSAGDVLECHFATGDVTWSVPTRLSLMEPAGGLMEPIYSFDQALSLLSGNWANTAEAEEEGVFETILHSDWGFNPLAGSLTLPSDIPGIGGAQLKLDLPIIPVNVAVEPTGGFSFAVNMDAIWLRYRGENFNPNDWKFMSKETAESWRERTTILFFDAMDRNRDAKKRAAGEEGFNHYPVISDFQAKISAGILANAQLKDDWLYGDAALNGALMLYFVFGQQYILCGIPCYLTFDATSNTSLTLAGGFKMRWLDFDTIQFTEPYQLRSGAALSISENIEIGLSGGVGVFALASFSLRAYGYLTFTYALTNGHISKEDGEETEVDVTPYLYNSINVSAGFGVQACVQLLLFKGTVTVLKRDNPDLLWLRLDDAGALEAGETNGASISMDGMLTSFDPQMTMISDHDLLAVREFVGAVSPDGTFNDTTFHGDAVTLPDPGVKTVYAQLEDGSYTTNYDPMHGVQPLSETKIYSHVSSDPRCKVVELDGVRYLCRLSVVEVSAMASDELAAAAGAAASAAAGAAAVAGAGASAAASTGTGATSGATTATAAPTLVRRADSSTNNLLYFAPAQTPMQTFGETPDQAPGSTPNAAPGSTPNAAPVSPDRFVLTSSDGALTFAALSLTEVESATVPRARVTVAAYDPAANTWSTPQLVDFPIDSSSIETMRANMHDMDFDVVAADGHLHFAITSAIRPIDDDLSFENQFEHQFTTYVKVLPHDGSLSVVNTSASLADMTYGRPTWNARAGIVSYTDNMGMKMRLVGIVSLARETDGLVDIEVRWYDTTTGQLYDSEIYERTSIERLHTDINGNITVANRPGLDEQRMLVAWSPSRDHAIAEGDAYETAVFDLRPGSTFAGSWKVAGWVNPTPLPANGSLTGFLYTKDNADAGSEKQLYMAYLNEWGALVVDQMMGYVSAENFFTSYSGSRLFVAYNLDERVLADEVANGTGRLASETPTCRYQIKAADAIGSSSFTAFYPFAQLGAPVDSLVNFSNSGYSTSFIYTSLLEYDDGDDETMLAADIYHVEIPYTAMLHLDDVHCVDAFYGAGDTCSIMLTVSNTGNIPIYGFEVDIYQTPDASSDHVAHIQVTMRDLMDRVEPSHDHYIRVLNEDGSATDEFVYDPDAVDESRVWPGKTRTYRLAFALPEQLEGEVDLYAFITDVYSNSGLEMEADNLRSERMAALRSTGNAGLALALAPGGETPGDEALAGEGASPLADEAGTPAKADSTNADSRTNTARTGLTANNEPLIANGMLGVRATNAALTYFSAAYTERPHYDESNLVVEIDPVGEKFGVSPSHGLGLADKHHRADYRTSKDPNGGGGTTPGGESGGGTSGNNELPQVGDDTNILGLGALGTAAASVAAGIALYEKRRAENERLH